MRHKFHETKRNVQEMLDSDDELPDEYNEVLALPAYQDDYRFEKVTFPWIKEYISHHKSDENGINPNSLMDIWNEEKFCQKTRKVQCGEKLLITTSVLNEDDIFCLKCIEPHIPDRIMLWFVNFLIYRDLQYNYKFPKSCLVNSIRNYENYDFSLSDRNEKRHIFDFVVK